MARKLTFVTAHARAGEALDLDWQALADPGATLAVYMGKAAAQEISMRLIGAGLPVATPVALIENASLANERQFRTRLDLLPLAAASALGDGPAILLIGEAMRPRAISLAAGTDAISIPTGCSRVTCRWSGKSSGGFWELSGG
jgi:uroporphyrin-III C-methyltransferase